MIKDPIGVLYETPKVENVEARLFVKNGRSKVCCYVKRPQKKIKRAGTLYASIEDVISTYKDPILNPVAKMYYNWSELRSDWNGMLTIE
jgi:hypothetical protein